MDLGLAGRVCAITGAEDGVGQAAARLLRAEGAKVLLVGGDAARLADAAEGLDGGDEEIATLPLDPTEPDAGEQILGAALEEFDGIDALVIVTAEPPLEDLRAAHELSVMAPMRAMKAIAPVLAERGWGRIVTVCPDTRSVAGTAELSLTRLFADRYAKAGVLVNAVCPEPGAVPAETAAEVVFLCSERASHVAGATWATATGSASTAGVID
jgi:NAD(P)-dependent dehydrogenase (short-subunit alcohol dehydrogenase family)